MPHAAGAAAARRSGPGVACWEAADSGPSAICGLMEAHSGALVIGRNASCVLVTSDDE